MKIWAHRGCSQIYPENTITAFSKAIEINELTGVELDIQMTKDGEIVVIHDERVDRTTDGIGYVKDFTYLQLRKLAIETGRGQKERIPSIVDVLDLMQEKMETGLLLNIELKNSEVPYQGMEERILNLVVERNLQERVVYSSFYTHSLKKIRDLESKASVGILDAKVSDCFYKAKGCFEEKDPEWGNISRIALHPFWKNMDLMKKELEGWTVRAWLTGHLYPEKPTGTRIDMHKLESMGITDVFLNEPERELCDYD